MKPDADAGGLERVWAYSILPLLEEHYYEPLTRQIGARQVRARRHPRRTP